MRDGHTWPAGWGQGWALLTRPEKARHALTTVFRIGKAVPRGQSSGALFPLPPAGSPPVVQQMEPTGIYLCTSPSPEAASLSSGQASGLSV